MGDLMRRAATIAVLDAGDAHWTAGAQVSRTMLRSMIAAGASTDRTLVFTSRQPTHDDARFASLGVEVATQKLEPPAAVRTLRLDRIAASRNTSDRRVRRTLALPDSGDPLAYLRRRKPDVVLPMLSVPVRPRLAGAIGWIPDFQHEAMPQLFGDVDRRRRTQRHAALVKRAALVLLSSDAMAAELDRYHPGYAHKVRVLPFPSMLGNDELVDDPAEVVRAYHVPPRFALVANQFWQHKNHGVVVEAVRRARDMGVRVPIVMTGLPADYRDPENSTFSRLMQQIAKADLAGQITVLGKVPYGDLVCLMREAAIVIQPSRYEGWNTSVEDAKALGRALVCSNIGVHVEQTAGVRVALFDVDDSQGLAEALIGVWAWAPARSDASEAASLERARERVVRYGNGLLDIADEAAGS
jgi:glycosyltransferase involved in cell wall biosynthesis